MSLWNVIVYILLGLYFLTILWIIVNVILENRNPVRTLAWMVFIIAVPFIGFFIYLHLGINYRKNKMFSRKELGDIKWLDYMSQTERFKLEKSKLIHNTSRYELIKLMRLLINNSKAIITQYNRIEILNNGDETYKSIFSTLCKAQKYIHLEYYIVEDGEIVNQLKEILIEKAKRGVEVRFIYDDVGSWGLSRRTIQEMRDAGIQIYPFLPVRFNSYWWKANYRNHRKIIIIDGLYGFLGGLNFADRYLKGIPKIGKWRDTHMKVKGEVVTALQIVFLIDWYFVRQELLLNKDEYLPYYKEDNHSTMQLVASGPDSDWASIQQTYFTMITMARKSVYISTPYFMPGETTLNVLKTAAMSGVDVRILLPSRSDSVLTYWCSRSYVEELLEAGVSIYWYNPGINHSKILITDDLVASVGTANMDMRSFEQNFEVNLIIYDKIVVQKLIKYYFDDLEESTQEFLAKWKFRPRRQRIKESLSRLFAPVL